MSLSGWIGGVSVLALMGGAQVVSAQNKLEPTGPPGPTMKTLDEIPPTWSQALPANDTGDPCNSSRFKCVLPTAARPTGAAVLDRETGLVWERSLDAQVHNWNNVCANRTTGDRKGWRMPAFAELASLLDPAQPASDSTPMLPPGHPFVQVRADYYWTATTAHTFDATLRMYAVSLSTGTVNNFDIFEAGANYIWCVRGGSGPEVQ